MSLAAFEKLIAKQTGIDPASMGAHTVERTAARRMKACRISNPDAYYAFVMQSPAEMDEFIEGLVIPETWFFRDKEPFVFLKRFIENDWLPGCRHKTLAVLSAPCSTGEEPYSIAMTLLEAGLTLPQFHIDAVDLSRQALFKAQEGLYGKYSFRATGPAMQNKYFSRTDRGLLLSQQVRRAVFFRFGNLLEDTWHSRSHRYDIIFCRNMLIYFEATAKKRLISSLDGLLKPGVLLFLGHAETLQGLQRRYTAVSHRRAFAYRKETTPSVPLKKVGEGGEESAGDALVIPPLAAAAGRMQAEHLPAGNGQKQPLRDARETAPPSHLARAKKLADRGELAAALEVCEKMLHKTGPAPGVFFLMGVICEAQGDLQMAECCLNKCIYLDPGHYEAMIQLALLLEKRRVPGRAMIFRQRAARIEKTKNTVP